MNVHIVSQRTGNHIDELSGVSSWDDQNVYLEGGAIVSYNETIMIHDAEEEHPE